MQEGWGKRNWDWQFSAGVQHELVPRVSVDVSYSRRRWGNFFVTQNRALGRAGLRRGRRSRRQPIRACRAAAAIR